MTIAPVSTQLNHHIRKAATPKEPQMPQEPVYSVEMIGPNEAVAYLGRNTDRNRRLRPHLVAVYAKDMSEGNWRLSNDAICFDRDGVLINGQHRLKAIVISGTSQQFFVIRGMDPLAFEYIDIGPSRTMADVLTIKGQKNANAVAAITAKAAGYTKSGYLNSSIARNGVNGTAGGLLHVSRKDKIHVTEVLSEIHYGAELGKRLSKAGQRLGLASAQIGFLYVLYQSWHTGVEDFIERVVNLRADVRGDSDPARRVGLRLLDAQSSTDVDKLSPSVNFGYLVIAANADFQQRSLGKLQWRRRNLYPQPVVQVASALATRLGWPAPKGMAEEPEDSGA